ncbi:cytochrome P450 [Durotheca rogersii]|uniref:cytochrome P450 n=1 Tax=Durotheca rogersii TaxID=419775 RepID=UPI0022200A30|nr:cytochrome P450 [Durotheca rogersii]KAI5857357.1 cytochrome P450 [Durotheca rogersii]
MNYSQHQERPPAESLSGWSDALQDWPPTSLATLAVLSLLLFPLFTKITSTLSFRYSLSTKPDEKRPVAPLVPYWLPGIYHAFYILFTPAAFVYGIIKKFGWERPFQLKAGPVNFTLLANPNHIETVFKNSRFLSAKSITRRSAKYLLDIPDKVLEFYDADDSGMAAMPRKGSKTLQENRILYQQTHTAQKYLASPYLKPLADLFADTLHRSVELLEIGEDWVDYPDLYGLMQVTLARANIEAMMGSKFLELNPKLMEHFWEAKKNAPLYFQGWPRWLIPKAFRERDRVLEYVEKWHTYAFANGDWTNTGENDPDWDPIFGSKYVKIRLQYMLKMKPLDAHIRAKEDWGLMFGSNGNTAPTAFWYLLEALRDPALNARMMAEVATCVAPDKTIDVQELAKLPLLQSVCAEVLRMRVSILVSRMVEFQDVKFSGYTIPREDFVLMPTDGVHFNAEAWAQAGRTSKVPLDKFDPERFLVDTDSGPQYSTEGLAGLWIPFGGGDRMCPGRHLAIIEILVTHAYLFSRYDIELAVKDTSGVKCDKKFAPFGALPPDRKVPIRIRRKT